MLVLDAKKIAVTSILLGVFAIALSVIIALLSPLKDDVIPPEESPEVTPTPNPRRSMLELDDSRSTVLFLTGGKVTEISMCDYLVGAVAAEMPAVFEHDALCAQAVALRTYTLHHIMISPPAAHPEADVCGDFGCCAAFDDETALREKWGDEFETNIARIEAAVRETDGVYISYEAEPILAVFHSSSYRATIGAEKVWSGAVPYLVSVPSPETEEEVANLKSTVTVTRDDFKSTVLASYPDAKLGDDARAWISDMRFDESGRVETIVIGGASLTGPQLRALFMLRSAAVSITIGDDFVFETMGYGHGVGMSQYGANIMAKNGTGWRDILKTYYTGVTLSDEPDSPVTTDDDDGGVDAGTPSEEAVDL